jgi:hypothetical protein
VNRKGVVPFSQSSQRHRCCQINQIESGAKGGLRLETWHLDIEKSFWSCEKIQVMIAAVHDMNTSTGFRICSYAA